MSISWISYKFALSTENESDDEFQFPENPNDPVIAFKNTRKGYIAVDGSFHPVDEETEDFSDLDHTLDYI